jgi:hypothetical protein
MSRLLQSSCFACLWHLNKAELRPLALILKEGKDRPGLGRYLLCKFCERLSYLAWSDLPISLALLVLNPL